MPLPKAKTSLLREQIDALGEWFHNLDLAGIPTAPNHFLGNYPRCKWESFADSLPKDLSGRTVLDLGCNAGFYAFEMKRRGADRVVAVDSDPSRSGPTCEQSAGYGYRTAAPLDL
jgi:tRNA (mo5U34)-methyltransferase